MGIRLADMELCSVSGGSLRVDGGNMFGVIPKTMWQKKAPADEQNRVLLQTRCMLIKTPQHRILIDTGYGSKHTERFCHRHALETGNPLVSNLTKLGITPPEIDIVVLTHLHFDHVGGCIYQDADNQLRIQFPNARHIIHAREWEDAVADRPELAGAYVAADLVPLKEAGLIDLVQEDHLVLDRLRLQHTGGHTAGHQIVHIGDQEEHLVYLADLCPTAAHLSTFWTLAYDQDQLLTGASNPEYWVTWQIEDGLRRSVMIPFFPQQKSSGMKKPTSQ